MKKAVLFLLCFLLHQVLSGQEYFGGILYNRVDKEFIQESNGFCWYKITCYTDYGYFNGAMDLDGRVLVLQCSNLSFVPVEGHVGYFKMNSPAGNDGRVYSAKGEFVGNEITHYGEQGFWAFNPFWGTYLTDYKLDSQGHAVISSPSTSTSTATTTTTPSVVTTGYGSAGGGYLIDNSSVGGKPASAIVGGSSGSSSSSRSNSTSSKYSDYQIKQQEKKVENSYKSYKNDPTITGGLYHKSQQKRLDEMKKHR